MASVKGYRLFVSLIFLTGLFLLTSSHARAASAYYVSPSGNDNNPGTSPSKPWKTTAKVNAITFSPGDQILFQGGQTFSGGLYFDSADKGTPQAPILVGSYGTGRSTINAGGGYGLFAYNTAGFQVTTINFVGSGRTTNTQSGINFYTDLPGNVKLNYLHINNVSVSGFGDTGILIGGWNGVSGYNDVRITNVSSHDNAKAGLSIYGQNLYSNTNVYIGHNQAVNNPGKSGLSVNSGNGIVIGSVNGGTIERSVAHDNGWIGFGSYGIWAYDSNNVTIRSNESYNNHTSGTKDGGGFDLDGGVTNSTAQYNYSHGNDGAGFGLNQFSGAPSWSGNTVRYNISENDGRKNGYPSIILWNGGSGIRNAEIYNNTIYMSAAQTGRPSAVRFVNATTNIHLRNNIFVTTNGLTLIDVASGQSGILFQGNDYYASGAAFVLRWYGTGYSSLSAWRTATGQESVGSTNTGTNANPQLTSPGGGGTIGNADLLNALTAYRLRSASPMINAGLDLFARFGIQPGPHDFFGTPIPQAGAFDIGANEFMP